MKKTIKKKKHKVFIIGLSKTGTTSLSMALRILGYRTKHFSYAFLRLKGNNLQLNMKSLAKYDASADSPIALFFKEIDKAFPNSKFILSTRNIDSWINSCKKHFRFANFYPYKHSINEVHKKLYGDDKFQDEEKFKKNFLKHEQNILEYFKKRKKDLLIMDIGNGDSWEKLCTFLEEDIPTKPFPKRNSTKNNPQYYLIPNTLYYLTKKIKSITQLKKPIK